MKFLRELKNVEDFNVKLSFLFEIVEPVVNIKMPESKKHVN